VSTTGQTALQPLISAARVLHRQLTTLLMGITKMAISPPCHAIAARGPISMPLVTGILPIRTG